MYKAWLGPGTNTYLSLKPVDKSGIEERVILK